VLDLPASLAISPTVEGGYTKAHREEAYVLPQYANAPAKGFHEHRRFLRLPKVKAARHQLQQPPTFHHGAGKEKS
jgi:hypothetical protein